MPDDLKEQPKKNGIAWKAYCSMVILFVGLWVGLWVGEVMENARWQKQTVMRGYGEYHQENPTEFIKWRWIEPKDAP